MSFESRKMFGPMCLLMHEDFGESLFKCFKDGVTLIREKPRDTLVGNMCEQNHDFAISVNEVMVEVDEAKERLSILDFSWYWPILDDLDFVQGHGEALR